MEMLISPTLPIKCLLVVWDGEVLSRTLLPTLMERVVVLLFLETILLTALKACSVCGLMNRSGMTALPVLTPWPSTLLENKLSANLALITRSV